MALPNSSKEKLFHTIDWHAIEVEETLKALETNKKGLNEDEAKRRLNEFGPNELREEKRTTPLIILLNQFRSILVIILVIAALVSGLVLREYVDMYVIGAIVVMNAILGFVQEYKAEKAVEALKKMVAPTSRIIREGKEKTIPSKDLVPGDIILFDEGVRIPADARLIEVASLKVDEAPLTGESVPIKKQKEIIPKEASLNDRKNMVFTGTNITYGRGKAVVTATGMKTSFGKIAEMVQTVDIERPPLAQTTERLGRQLGLISLAFTIAIFVIGYLVHEAELTELFMISVSMAVSAIPEGLPAVITITLSFGMLRMARRNAVVRKLASVETLGSTDVICSDKTGTLTKGEMTVRKIYTNNQIIEVTGVGYEPKGEFQQTDNSSSIKNDQLSLLLRIGALCTNAGLENEKSGWHVIGDPTEGSLVVAAGKAGMWKEEIEKEYPRIGEIPFSSERKMMTTIHQTPEGKQVAYIKGAPETVLKRCTHTYKDAKTRRLTEQEKRKLLETNDAMASEALRVLGLAYKELPATLNEFTEENVENKLVFVGLMGMIDPPREEAKKANLLCQQAGIKAIMITGDHRLTAVAVAKELEILKDGLVLTGTELDKMNEEEFEGTVEKVTVYARVSPEHKLRIVKALKKQGHTVAMTGDGVNDAPAIKTADIGVAMGITGTDVTKEAASMVLEDDNFATIVSAVEEGRGIYDNIKKYMRLMLSTNFDEFFEIAVASLLGLPLPIIAIQILWINLVTDGIPAVALSVDPKDPEIMKRLPRDRNEGFLRPMWRFLLYTSTLDFVADFTVFIWVLTAGLTSFGPWIPETVVRARTVAFTAVVFFEFFLAYNCRSETHSIWGLGWKGITANKMLLLSVIAGTILQMAIVYVPALNTVFKTVPLTTYELGLSILGGCTALLIFPGKLLPSKKVSKTE